MVRWQGVCGNCSPGNVVETMNVDEPTRIESILEEIDRLRARSMEMFTTLERTAIRRSDDRGIVTSTANALGKIISVDIGGRVTHPDLLGDQVTSTIRSCRNAARMAQDHARSVYMPEISSVDDIRSAFRDVSSLPGLKFPGDIGSSRERNRMAESLESLDTISKLNLAMDRAVVSQDIANGVGSVRVNVAGSYIKVILDPQASGLAGYRRLGSLIVKAIADLEFRCAKIKQKAIDDIRVGDTRVGRIVAGTYRLLGYEA